MRKLFRVAMMFAAVAVPALSADQHCETGKGILQARIEVPTWIGDVHVVIGETDVLTGAFRPIAPPQRTGESGIGLETGLKLKFDFGAQGSISFEVPNGITLQPAPGPNGSAEYRGIAKVIEGTGRFEKTTGTLLIDGMYILWFEDPQNPATVWGRWNANLTMRLCKAR